MKIIDLNKYRQAKDKSGVFIDTSKGRIYSKGDILMNIKIRLDRINRLMLELKKIGAKYAQAKDSRSYSD